VLRPRAARRGRQQSRNTLPRAFAVLLLGSAAAPAAAHEWYDPACCSEKDCAPIVAESVVVDDSGDYIVTIEAGAHPLVELTQTWHWPRLETRASRDSSWHGCVSSMRNAAGQQRLLCLYAPTGF
jgi:hypothetical protein